MTTRREIIKAGAGLTAILAAGKAPAYLVRSMLGARGAVLFGGKPGGLPYDAEVEYLQTDGNAYIATGVTPPTGATVKTELTFGFTSYSVRRFLFSDSNQDVTHYCEVNAGAQYGAGSAYISQTLLADTMYNATATFTSALASYSIDINGTQYTSSTTMFPSSDWHELILFRINSQFRGTGQRIGACKIYVNGVLVRDFIPVRVGTTGELYDRVSGKFADRTGDFVVGPDVVPVEWLDFTGSQCLDLGFYPTQATTVSIDLIASATLMSNIGWLSAGNPSNAKYEIYPWNNSIQSFYANASKIYDSAVHTGDRIKATFGKELFIQNITSSHSFTHTFADATFTASYKATIGALNRGGYSYFAIMRLYSVMVGGDRSQRLLPVRVGTEGAMMDTLTRRIYRNAGTGAFTYGNDLKYPIPA